MKSGKIFSSGTTIAKLDLGALFLRLIGGGFMVYSHGSGKFSLFFADKPIEFIDPVGLGETATLAIVVFAEAVCAVMVLIGLLTRWATIPLLCTMLCAAFVAHGADDFGKKELALIYLFIYLIILLIGPGRFSIDRLMRKRRSTIQDY